VQAAMARQEIQEGLLSLSGLSSVAPVLLAWRPVTTALRQTVYRGSSPLQLMLPAE
jgi:hypothetical protein